MPWNAISRWRQKRKLRKMVTDRRPSRGVRSIGQLEKGIGADRATTERLLLAIGARKAEKTEDWTLAPSQGTAAYSGWSWPLSRACRAGDRGTGQSGCLAGSGRRLSSGGLAGATAS